MPKTAHRLHVLAWFACLWLALAAACTTAQPTQPSASPTATLVLNLYRTPTTTPAPRATAAQSRFTPTPPPPPSPTPYLYTIVKDDTMLGIALRFGLTLDALLAANPQTDPRFLTIGNTVVIPVGEGGLPVAPSPTPLPVMLGAPLCYRQADASAWCFVQVSLPFSGTLENLSALIHLADGAGNPLGSTPANAPLNLVSSDQPALLLAYFPAPLPVNLTARAELLSALQVQPGTGRYLAVELTTLPAEIVPGGGSVRVAGEVSLLPVEALPAPQAEVWVAVLAFDARGQPVGLRRWEAPQPYPAGSQVPFELEVFSLGAAVDHVQVFTEARIIQ